ncbi:MAG: acylphosphatase [Candidatus Gracilibacteria bacterium]|nr:acylphosphatase [Candidatus Gracilibacteria bacterium]MDD5179110.1 acylphosphatase [Candidatus Gracilibacteria bacterium]
MQADFGIIYTSHMQLELKITGKVQGVWYRDHTRKEALRLGLRGFARNEADGSVIVIAVGSKEKLQQLRKWCETGSPKSEVNSVIENWSEEEESFAGFEIY